MPKGTWHSLLPHLIFAVTYIQMRGQTPALVSGQTLSYSPPKSPTSQTLGQLKCTLVSEEVQRISDNKNDSVVSCLMC